jgi:putative GTP pyrophosphokinase
MDDEIIQKILVNVKEKLHYFETFQQSVIALFTKDPRLNGTPPILHSIKSRVKHADHLMQKIKRRNSEFARITPENVF